MRNGYRSTNRGDTLQTPPAYFLHIYIMITGRNSVFAFNFKLKFLFNMSSRKSESVTSQQPEAVDDDARMTRRVLWKLDCHILPPLALVGIQIFE